MIPVSRTIRFVMLSLKGKVKGQVHFREEMTNFMTCENAKNIIMHVHNPYEKIYCQFDRRSSYSKLTIAITIA